jgi:hypothetical protein
VRALTAAETSFGFSSLIARVPERGELFRFQEEHRSSGSAVVVLRLVLSERVGASIMPGRAKQEAAARGDRAGRVGAAR